MGEKGLWLVIVAALVSLLFGCLPSVPVDTTTPRMTKEELKSALGNPAVVVVDVRLEDEWKMSRWKIKGAVREDLEKDIDSWAGKYSKDRTLVFYCS